jgi:hypothetical protein
MITAHGQPHRASNSCQGNGLEAFHPRFSMEP